MADTITSDHNLGGEFGGGDAGHVKDTTDNERTKEHSDKLSSLGSLDISREGETIEEQSHDESSASSHKPQNPDDINLPDVARTNSSENVQISMPDISLNIDLPDVSQNDTSQDLSIDLPDVSQSDPSSEQTPVADIAVTLENSTSNNQSVLVNTQNIEPELADKSGSNSENDPVVSDISNVNDDQYVDSNQGISNESNEDGMHVETIGEYSSGMDVAEIISTAEEPEVTFKGTETEITSTTEDPEVISKGDEADIISATEEPEVMSKGDDTEIISTPEEVGVSKGDGEKSVTTEDLKEVTEDGYMDVLGNGLLKKKVIRAGQDSAAKPVYSDVVTISVQGCLENGSPIDNNPALQFTVGDGDTIQAFELCVTLMQVGEVCELITAANYAYGSIGRDPDVPPNATITYILELTMKEIGPDIDKMSLTDRIQLGDQKRERGNYLFQRQDYTGAINSYTKSLRIVNDDMMSHTEEAPVLQQFLDIRMKSYNNLAACQIKIEAYDAAIKSCDAVLRVQPENVKALFRKGKALTGKGNTREAIPLLKKALQLEPETKIIHQELSRITSKLKRETESEKRMYKKMFGQTDAGNSKKSNKSWFQTWGLMLTGAAAAIAVSVGVAVYRNTQH